MAKNLSFKRLSARYKDFIRFSPFILPYWKMKALTMALSGLLVPLGLVMPFLTKLLIDKAYGNKDLGLFIRLVIFGAAVFIIIGIIEGTYNYFEGRLRIKVSFDVNSRVFSHITSLPLSFFQDRPSGEHHYKINFDSERLTHLLTTATPQLILLAGRLFFILVITFYLNWRMALVCVILTPALYLQANYFVVKREGILQKQIKISQEIFASLTAVFKNIYLVKAFGQEGFEIKYFANNLLKKTQLLLEDTKLQLQGSFTGRGIRRFVLGIISVYGGYQIIKNQVSLGSLTAIMIYFSQLFELQASLSEAFEQIVFDFASADRITEIFNREPDIADSPDAVGLDFSDSDIEFRNVAFAYKDSREVLKDLSFSIKYGSTIALVGSSGCGKTTLLNLLLRLYCPQKGEILIGGKNIKEVKLDCFRSQIAAALQAPFLWNDTFLNNIRYAKQDASLEEVKEAAQLSQIGDFIESLPEGYNMPVGEMASKVSEGQKQRIAIARAIVKNPNILILDEAMSSLDSKTEEKIIANIKEKFRHSTVIIVSHRLSSVKNLDLVYFLEAPNKIDSGSHTELLERNLRYKELFAGQI